MIENFNKQLVTIFYASHTPTYFVYEKFYVDVSIVMIKIIVSGRLPKISLISPKQNEKQAQVIHDSSITNVQFIEIKYPENGSWQIGVNCDSIYSIKIIAISDIHFNYGFSLNSINRIEQTFPYPLLNATNILIVELDANNLKLIKNISDATLTTDNDVVDVLNFMKIIKNKSSTLYFTDPFMIRSVPFKTEVFILF